MSDYETLQRKRNITVGLFVIVAVCALIWLIYKFGDLPVFVSHWKSFQVEVKFSAAPGVQENTPVRFSGYQVGRVAKVMPPEILRIGDSNSWSYQTRVIINIKREYENKIPKDAEVKLMTRGFGSSYIKFKAKPFDVEKPTGEFVKDNDLLQGSTGTTSEIFPEETQKKLDELVDGIKALVKNANDVLGDAENKQSFKKSLGNLSKMTEKSITAVDEFQNFTVSMIGTSEELSKTLSELKVILEKINSGEGSAAKLLNDGRFYENMLENTEQLHTLMAEIKDFIAHAKEKGLPIKVK